MPFQNWLKVRKSIKRPEVHGFYSAGLIQQFCFCLTCFYKIKNLNEGSRQRQCRTDWFDCSLLLITNYRVMRYNLIMQGGIPKGRVIKKSTDMRRLFFLVLNTVINTYSVGRIRDFYAN